MSATTQSRVYTIEELLQMRNKSIATYLPDVPQKGQDQGNPPPNRPPVGETRTIGRGYKGRPQLPLPVPVRSKNDASAGSDETVFLRHQRRRGTIGSIPADAEWKYRGRTESEAATSAEPLSAPTGLNAQQSEGFQRFYKAVVSPTHIRVTAGGRIVPNTRGVSPMSKRSKEATEGESQGSSNPPARQQAQEPEGSFSAAPKNPGIPMFAVPNPFCPPFPASMSQIPMMPVPMGVGLPAGFQFPQQMPIPPVPLANTKRENDGDGSNIDDSDSKAVASEKPHEKGVPDQFDQMKPFMINGQVVYPFPAFPQQLAPGSQSQYMAPGFMGHPAFSVAAFPNGMMAPLMNPMFAASMGYPSFQGQPSMMGLNGHPQMVPLATRAPSSGTMQPPPAPPISSIRPSEISKKQIDLLRNSLKYHEDQLQYNKHQIDEKEMERTIAMLQSQIDRFEALNKSQLLFEDLHYPRRNNRSGEPSRQASQASDKRSSVSMAPQMISRQDTGGTRRSGSGHYFPPITSRRKPEPCFNFEPIEQPVQFTDPIKKSTLPSGAALAPPFEPRIIAPSDRGHAHKAGYADNNGSRFARSQQDGLMPDHHTSSTLANGRRQDHSSSAERGVDLGRPYLVGMLPAGMSAQTARDSDFVYERELNEDEIRSRYLYWGKAPQFTREGLPRFDGKDFYPPSPTRDTSNDDDVGTVLKRNIPIGNPEVDFGFGSISKGTSRNFASSRVVGVSRKGVKVTLKRPKEDPKPASQEIQSSGTNADYGDHGGHIDGHARTNVLPNMLKRNISANSDVLPGTFSPATAQGILPQYSSGYDSLLAASLSPAIPSPKSSGQPSPIKSDDGSIFISPSRKIGENRPPPDDVGPASLEQKFRSIVTLENKQTTALPVHWESH